MNDVSDVSVTNTQQLTSYIRYVPKHRIGSMSITEKSFHTHSGVIVEWQKSNEFRNANIIKYSWNSHQSSLTHWGRATHICFSKLTIIASDNSLSPGRRQAIIWNNAGILSIGLSGTNFSEILIEILTFSFKKMRLKVSSAKWRPFCLGLYVLTATERIPSRNCVKQRGVFSYKNISDWFLQHGVRNA